MTTRQVPESWRAGDTISFTIDYNLQPAFDLVLKVTGPAGDAATTVEYAVIAGVVTIPAATTALLLAGRYAYALVEQDLTESYTLEDGQLTVTLRADLMGGDNILSHARKMLLAIEAVLEDRATLAQSSYSIKDRSLSRIPPQELLALRRYYQELVSAEEGRAKANQLRVCMDGE